MSKNVEKRKGGFKLWLLILSFVLSCVLWVYVTIELDPDTDKTIENITPTFINEEIFIEKGLAITAGRDFPVSVTFRGPRSALYELTSDTVKVVVDLKSITNVGLRYLSYTVDFPSSLNGKVSRILENSQQPYVEVTVDQLVNASFPVRLNMVGEVAENRMAEEAVLEPAVVTVRGPSKVMELITQAQVTIIRDVFDKSIENELLPFELLDADGNVVEDTLFTTERSEVNVTLPIVMTKKIPLTVDIVDGGGATAANLDYTVTPREIEVSGSQEALDLLNSLSIGKVDLSQLPTGSFTQNYAITVPNGIKYLTGIPEASVTYVLKGLKERQFEIGVYGIRVENASPPEGYELVTVTQNVIVKVRGTAEVIDKLEANQIQVVADLSGQTISPGMFNVTATVKVPQYPEVGAVGTVNLALNAVKKQAEMSPQATAVNR